MSAHRVYQLQVEGSVRNEPSWHPLMGAQGNKSYVLGWAHGCISYLPHRAFRMVEIGTAGYSVVEEWPAAGAPRPA